GSERFVIPPLRDRPEDIGLFASYFLRDKARTFDIWAYQALFLHRWPGNVRELEKVLRNASILASGRRQIGLGDLPLDSSSAGRAIEGRGPHEPRTQGPSTPLPGWTANPAAKTLPAVAQVRPAVPERPTPQLLASLLERHRGNVGHVARELGRQRTLVW